MLKRLRNPLRYTVKLARANLPAMAADNSYEVFIVRIRADFFKPRDVSFYLVPNTLTKVTICCLLKLMVNLSNLILLQKKLDCSLLALQTIIQKNSSLKKFSLPSK